MCISEVCQSGWDNNKIVQLVQLEVVLYICRKEVWAGPDMVEINCKESTLITMAPKVFFNSFFFFFYNGRYGGSEAKSCDDIGKGGGT